jgi:hypothetical protein
MFVQGLLRRGLHVLLAATFRSEAFMQAVAGVRLDPHHLNGEHQPMHSQVIASLAMACICNRINFRVVKYFR